MTDLEEHWQPPPPPARPIRRTAGELGCRFMDRSGFRNHRSEKNKIISQVPFTNLENPLRSEFTNTFNHVHDSGPPPMRCSARSPFRRCVAPYPRRSASAELRTCGGPHVRHYAGAVFRTFAISQVSCSIHRPLRTSQRP